MILLHILLAVLTTVLVASALVFSLEVLLAVMLPRARPSSMAARRPRVAVLVPAHDEEGVIGATVKALARQRAKGDRLIVIADNCTDDTAREAATAGAEVWQRQDPDRRGKGYAISFALERLASAPPEVVLFVDADCRLSPDAVDRLARTAARHGRPVQARNLVRVPASAGPVARVSALAFLVRNLVRPLGLKRLGLPCGLGGTGMALPWSLVHAAPATGADLVEDMVLGLELARAGHPPLFCPESTVESPQPAATGASLQQRRRWEHGHLNTLVRRAPRLVADALGDKRSDLLALALDLLVPPLALLTTLLFAAALLGGGLALLGGPATVLVLAGGALLLVALVTLLAWLRFGRDTVSFTTLLLAPLYVLKKLPLYFAFALRRRQRAWLRSARETPTAKVEPTP